MLIQYTLSKPCCCPTSRMRRCTPAGGSPAHGCSSSAGRLSLSLLLLIVEIIVAVVRLLLFCILSIVILIWILLVIVVVILCWLLLKRRDSKQGNAWSCAELHGTAWSRLRGPSIFLRARARRTRRIPHRVPSLTSLDGESLKGGGSCEVLENVFMIDGWKTELGRRSTTCISLAKTRVIADCESGTRGTNPRTQPHSVRPVNASYPRICRDRRQCTLGDPCPQRGVQPRKWAQWVIQSLGTTPGPRLQ